MVAKTEVLPTKGENWLGRALDVIAAGGVVALPTDTVYGIGADPFNTGAVAKLYQAKGRPPDKAIPILLGDADDLDLVAQNIPAYVEALTASFWPGALTLVLEKRSSVPQIVSSTGTIGVRVPDHPVALKLLQASGPLAVTSANLSGEVEARDASGVLAGLEGKIEMIVDGGLTPGGLPSTVIDCTSWPAVILRQGPISQEQILSELDGV